MPAIIYAKVVLEGRSEHEHCPGGDVQVDVTCVRSLLDDIRATHPAGFESTFGAVTVHALLEDWQQNGLKSLQIPGWVEKLRKAAFDAESLGEAPVEFRNRRELPDVAAGVVPVLCAILEHLAGCCGSDGMVVLVVPDKTS
jgi:hypothetical protein